MGVCECDLQKNILASKNKGQRCAGQIMEFLYPFLKSAPRSAVGGVGGLKNIGGGGSMTAAPEVDETFRESKTKSGRGRRSRLFRLKEWWGSLVSSLFWVPFLAAGVFSQVFDCYP